MTNGSFDKRSYWEWKLLPWEDSRYGRGSWLRPGSWTLRRRMLASEELVRRHVPGGCRVLELGCGSGLLAERLRDHFGSYVGIDLAGAAIERARSRLHDPGIRFLRGNVLEEELPEADVTVFLGLVDWLDCEEVSSIFRRIRSRFLLFSYTDSDGSKGPYALYRAFYDQRFGRGIYRARSYSRESVDRWVGLLGKHRVVGSPAKFFDPGRLVLVERDPV